MHSNSGLVGMFILLVYIETIRASLEFTVLKS
jgi:hypothetical protein